MMMIMDCISCTTLFYLAGTAAIGAVLFLVGFHLYLVSCLRMCTSKARMNGKTVIITGCTSGIGKETLKDLANRGARIIMACRNLDAANKLKGSILLKSNISFLLPSVRSDTILTKTKWSSLTSSHSCRMKIIITI